MKENMSKVDMRDAVFGEIYALARRDKNVFFLTADMGAHTLIKFREEMPQQFLNLGIAEQNMINVAAGMALSGKTVFVHSLIPFVVMRCFEQIKADVCSMGLSVIIVGGGPGFAYENDGPTHHGLEDIACMRSLGNMKIYNPCDAYSAAGSVKELYRSGGPGYIRMDKGVWPQLYGCETDIQQGFLFLEGGEKKLEISTGTLSHKKYQYYCQHRKDVSFLNLLRLDVFDDRRMQKNLTDFEEISVSEENVGAGGVADMISRVYLEKNTKIRFSAKSVKNGVGKCPYGDREYLLESNDLV